MTRKNTVRRVANERTLTKADIVEEIYAESFNTQKRAVVEQNVDTLISLIKQAIIRDHELLISGFGKFEAYEKAERKGRNPHTNEIMILPARRVVAFRLSRKFRAELDQANASCFQKEAAE